LNNLKRNNMKLINKEATEAGILYVLNNLI